MSKEFEIWTEGYVVNEESNGATFHGKFKGETFKDAIISYRNTLTDKYLIQCVDIEKMSFWGCRFFDNEIDARKSFG